MSNSEDKFSSTIHNFCSETTVHGLSRTVASRSRKEKGFWLLVLLFCTGYALYQVFSLVFAFLEYPVDVKLDVRDSNFLQFPAITLCNINPYRKSQVNSTMSGTQSGNESLSIEASLSKSGRISLQAIRDRFRFNVSASDDNEKRRIGHQAKDLILECMWQGIPCDYRNFTWHYNPVFGSCFTFGGINNILHSDTAGPENGLSLTLDIESHEYMSYFAESSGVVVHVHNPQKFPFPEDEGLKIAPGEATSIGISATMITRLPLPYEGTDCGKTQIGMNIYGDAYSEIGCRKSCVAKYQAANCGCVSSVFPVRNICDTDNKTLTRCLQEVAKRVRTSEIRCDCMPECRETFYNPTLSSTVWPSQNFMPVLTQILNGFGKKSFENLTQRDLERIRSTLVRVEIYYTSLNLKRIDQEPRYNAEDLIALVGGSLGLFVGASILSLLEVFKFMFDLCVAWMRRQKARKQGKVDSEMPP